MQIEASLLITGMQIWASRSRMNRAFEQCWEKGPSGVIKEQRRSGKIDIYYVHYSYECGIVHLNFGVNSLNPGNLGAR